MDEVHYFESILSPIFKMYKIWSYLKIHFKNSDEFEIEYVKALAGFMMTCRSVAQVKSYNVLRYGV